MKIKITEEMIKGPYGKIDKLFKTPDGFITNGEWMIREEYIELPENHPEIKDIKNNILLILIGGSIVISVICAIGMLIYEFLK